MNWFVTAAATSILAAGCGYRLQGGPNGADGPLAVVAAPTIVASNAAVEAILAGARQELAAQGRLARCDPSVEPACPALVVELVRVEESGAAPGISPSGAPVDRAMTFTLRGRAFVRRGPTGTPERVGTDEVSRESVARPDDPRAAHVIREEALRRAARRLGARLTRSIVW